MRVLHVLPTPILGGAEIATRRLADAVRPFGVESTALLLRPTPELSAYLQQAGLPCITDVQGPEPSLVRSAPRFLRDSWKLRGLCAEFDIVHCADTAAAYSMGLAARLARRPVLCHVRNREAKMPLRNRPFVGAADHFTFVSEATRKAFGMPLPERRASVLYDGVDIPRAVGSEEREAIAAGVRAEFGLPADAQVAAMFARLHPAKDFATLIRAAALLRDSHPHLFFLMVGEKAQAPGRQEHFEWVQELARAAGVLDRFVFAGFRADTHRLMVAADIFVHCTHIEGFPLVVIEAMAAGRPCVATAVDGIPEALTPGVTGLLHAHEDAGELAAALARLVDEPGRAKLMGERARLDAEQRFSAQRFARDAFALYSRLAPRQAGAGARAMAYGASAKA